MLEKIEPGGQILDGIKVRFSKEGINKKDRCGRGDKRGDGTADGRAQNPSRYSPRAGNTLLRLPVHPWEKRVVQSLRRCKGRRTASVLLKALFQLTPSIRRCYVPIAF